MLAEWAVCRRVACLLGDADWDPALDSVRDRERLFFFFSWGLLQGKWLQTKTQQTPEERFRASSQGQLVGSANSF